ncbi:MAG: deoxyribodipyrimidine photolyase, partial [Legionellales bacterium]|nr:deoxyribodipyrimidine photolyase [Legionellales bacterium]
MQIVWFKRDLRINDHVCLSQASSTGPVIPLYIIEPKLWMSPDLSHRHYEFLKECLAELNDHLTQLGQPLILKFGEAEDVLKQIIENHPIKAVWAHQETWNGWTYQRDITIRRFLKQKKIPFHEPPHNGVIRCLDNRNGWAARWYQSMKKPTLSPPKSLTPINITSDPLPRPSQLGLDNDGCKLRQHGGRSKAIELMESFLKVRGKNYTKEMSSPVTAFESCSRLSPHFAFGTLSIREAFHRAQAHQKIIKEL